MPFAKMSKTNRRTDILPNLVAVKKKMGRLMEEVPAWKAPSGAFGCL